MSTIGYINVSMEIFGGLLSLIFIFCLFITHRTHRQKAFMERLYIRLLICNTILLLSDATAWIFKGRPDGFSYYAVRISNFLVFTLGLYYLHSTSQAFGQQRVSAFPKNRCMRFVH